MQSVSQTFRRAFRGFSSPLMRQKSGLIMQSHQALGSYPQIFLLTLSMVGYDNSMKKASSDMKPGVSKSVNLGMNSVGVRHMNGDSLKIKRPTSQALGLVSNRLPSNKINKTSIKVKVETPPRFDKTNHDMVKVGSISAGLVSAFLLHRLFF